MAPTVDLGLLDPATQRVRADPELLRDPTDHTRRVTTRLRADLQHHPQRPLAQLDRILLRPPPRTTGRHNSILDSEVGRLRGSQPIQFDGAVALGIVPS